MSEVINIDELFEQYLPDIKGSDVGWSNPSTHEGFLEYMEEESRGAGVVMFLEYIDKVTKKAYTTIFSESEKGDEYAAMSWYTIVVKRDSDKKLFKIIYCLESGDYGIEAKEVTEVIEVKTIKKYI